MLIIYSGQEIFLDIDWVRNYINCTKYHNFDWVNYRYDEIVGPWFNFLQTATLFAWIGAVFGAVGTAGQRCTSTRRLIIHESVYDKVKHAVVDAYKQLRIGNPLDENNHVGPLIDTDAVRMYNEALEKVVEDKPHVEQ